MDPGKPVPGCSAARVATRMPPPRRGADRRRRGARRWPDRERRRGRRRRTGCAAPSGRAGSRERRGGRGPPPRFRARPEPRPPRSGPGAPRTADCASIPSSIRRMIVCRTADLMRLEPPLPSPASSSPSRSTTVGDIIEGTRRPGGLTWKPSGLRSSSPSMLLTCTPVSGTITPEPVPLEQVTAAHRPSASTAVMWVVEPSRSPGTSVGGSGGRSPARTRCVAASIRGSERNSRAYPSS